MERVEGVVVVGRAEIDTRAPFRSVKEAVMMFGERVLAGEIYANKLKEMQSRESSTEDGQHNSRFGAVSAELEETKQSLQKAREEGHFMAYCLRSLKQELEQTKRELQHLKTRELFHRQQQQPPPVDPEIREEVKFIENSSRNVKEVLNAQITAHEDDGFGYCDQRRRSVKFASPPSLAHIITTSREDVGEAQVEASTCAAPSPRKNITITKRKPLFPLIGGLFSKKKGSQQPDHQSLRALKPINY